jgi:DNA mismatch endonuclease (patch repair protein)
MPKTRVEFWKKKFKDNVKRDRRVAKTLINEGWQIVVVWEDETMDRVKLEKIVKQRIGLILKV